MKRFIKRLISIFLPLVLAMNRCLRALAAAGHRLQFLLQWRFGLRAPHSFDPFIDLYWQWETSRSPMSWERGIFGLLAMKPGCRLLDICCGEGFYAHRFYSGRAGTIVAMDYNIKAIAYARRNFQAPNIDYRCGDVRVEMPEGPFDNISWDAGIEYFTLEEIGGILDSIKKRLAPQGVLSGYSILVPSDGTAEIQGQKYAAASREGLGRLLSRFFRHVTIIRTVYPDRTNHYFFASDGPVPLAQGWMDMLRLGDSGSNV
jgi:ubiquinone/menaquinone biosynthesis C-methylase UbiE